MNINQNNTFGDNSVSIHNQGKPPRTLQEPVRRQLRELLPADKKVDIVAVLGDGEAFRFAGEIKTFLVSNGYDVEGVSQVVYGEPVMGQIVDTSGDLSRVIIGTQE